MAKLSKAFALTTGILGLFGAPAMAADIPVKAAPPPPAAVSWTGIYWGGHGGWMGSRPTASFPAGFNPALQIVGVAGQGFASNYTAGIVGLQIGYQFQFSNIVLGIEAGVSSPLRQSVGKTRPMGATQELCPRQTIALFECYARIDGPIYTVGGRGGWSFGAWLPYAAGGFAATEFWGEASNNSLAPVGVSIVQWFRQTVGWYVGGGLEWAVAPAVTVGVEYRHYEFDTRLAGGRATIGGIPNSLLINDTANFKLNADTVALRLNIKFDPFPRAIAARY